MDNDEDLPMVEIIGPTAEEISEGLENLEKCWPVWKRTPALLVSSEDDLGLIVSAVDCAHDDFGFALQFTIHETILAPPDFNGEEYSVGFGWNQPYLSFSHESISAPYAYYLHFEHAGVERVRELIKAIRKNRGELPSPRSFRRCFGRDGAEYFADRMSRSN